ncbi:MAG: cytochrome-c oxidase, cbb3-type subunit II [Helicobacteraceae bacterium]|jgi:cytochrome c oxidase cbb3-type subunit 2|nr:cytochrome-c oxidase, cbb3-type subunit II [Helicobacteraceae bacterium]
MFHWLEKNPFFFAVAVFLTIAFAGLVEILPGFAQSARPVVGVKPQTILQLAGKNIYLQENCNACHSQLIRPFKSETDRYGHYSLSGEFAYDRPFVWGSKRTGPDLMRVGNYRTSDWHEAHLKDPQGTVDGSIMPPYPWLFRKSADIDTAYAEALTVMKVFNTPYNVGDNPKVPASLSEAKAIALEEAKMVAGDMKDPQIKSMVDSGNIPEVVALIAYLNSRK